MSAPPPPFADRAEAGRLLGQRLGHLAADAPVILALPRGGVPVALEIARALAAPLDLVLVRKIGAPSQPELAVGAVVDGGRAEVVVNDAIARQLQLSQEWIDAAAARELGELERRRQHFLTDRAPLPIEGRTAVLVDDGIATGATMEAALKATRRAGAKRLVLAAPVAPRETIDRLGRLADEVVCLATPRPFRAIGLFYRDFGQIDDAEVVEMLARAPSPPPPDKDEGP